MARSRVFSSVLLILAGCGSVLHAAPLPSQVGAVQAVVVDATGRHPVAGATVSIVGRPGTFRTDATGRFSWPDVPLPVVVVITRPDGRMARPIRVDQVDPLASLELLIAPAIEDAVTVMGTSPGIDVAPGASAITLTRRDLALRRPATVTQALETVAGAWFIAEGQAAVPTLRGLARGRTLVLMDGARVSSERRAGPSASLVDPSDLAAIEVARGPASVAYGSDAFGGVVALRTGRPARDAPLTVRLATTAAGGVPEQSGSMEISRGYGTGGWLIAARIRDVDDYLAPDGRVPNSGWRDGGVRVAWDQNVGDGTLSVGLRSDLGRDLGRPRSDAATMRVTSPRDSSHRLTASYEAGNRLGFSRVTVQGLVGYEDERVEQDRLPTSSRPRGLTRADLRAWDMQIRATGTRNVGAVRMQLGTDLTGRYGLRAVDTEVAFTQSGAVSRETTTVSIDRAARTAIGAFVQAEVQAASWLGVTGGLRTDVVHSTTRGGVFGARVVTHGAVAGFGALTVTPFEGTALAGLSFTGQLTRGFRDPTLSDRFYRGPVGRGIVEGNPLLAPETSRQLDLTARHVAGAIRMSMSYYEYRITNLVERYAAGPDLFRFRNRGSARLRGVELEAQAGLAHGFSIETTAETSRGWAADGAAGGPAGAEEASSETTPLDDIAPARVAAMVRHSAAGARLSSYIRLSRIFAHAAAGPTEVATPGHTQVDVAANWAIRPGIEVRAVARNLLDQRFYASAGPRWVFGAGRHGSLTLLLTF